MIVCRESEKARIGESPTIESGGEAGLRGLWGEKKAEKGHMVSFAVGSQ